MNSFITDNAVSIRISQMPGQRHLPVNSIIELLDKKHTVEVGGINSISIDEFKSPRVGVYYSSHHDKTKSYIVTGYLVNPGDRLGVIRVMNVNTVIYDSGKMIASDILIKNSQPVEYVQTLYVVKYS